MDHIEHLGRTFVPNALGSLVVKVLREFIHDLLEDLDCMNRAAVEGKALDHIREQLIGLRGVEDVLVDKTVLFSLTKNYPEVLVFVRGPLAHETHSQMNHVLIAVNKRYGTDIRARIVDWEGKASGNAPG
jgi:hypothetical protein